MIWLLLAIVISAVLAAIFWLWHRQNSPTKKGHSAKRLHNTASKTNTKYHCVTVHGDSVVCEGIMKLQGKSLLPNEAPTLPLATCDMHACKCHYIHHDDRRLRNRREPFGELNSTSIASNDRPLRARVDRRKASQTVGK